MTDAQGDSPAAGGVSEDGVPSRFDSLHTFVVPRRLSVRDVLLLLLPIAWSVIGLAAGFAYGSRK